MENSNITQEEAELIPNMDLSVLMQERRDSGKPFAPFPPDAGARFTVDEPKTLYPEPPTVNAQYDFVQRVMAIDREVERCWREADNLGWHKSWEKLQVQVTQGTRTHEDVVNWINTKLFLVTSELVEAMDELRAGRDITEVYYSDPKDERKADEPQRNEDGSLNKPEGFLVECADAVIRIFDLVGVVTEGSPSFGKLLLEKLEFNATRGQMHGGKKF